MLSIDQGIITYRETPLSWPLRAFIALIGLSTGIGIPAAWLANASFSMPLLSLTLLGVVVVTCAGFGALLIVITFASVNELRIDPADDCVTRTRRSPLVNGTTRIPRRDLGLPTVIMRDSDDGPFPILHLTFPGGRRFEMANFDTRAQAELWRDRIGATLTATGEKISLNQRFSRHFQRMRQHRR
jgi:hypothetical protein